MFKDEAATNGPQVKYLRLLSTFIKCADEVIKANQENVLKLFFQDIDNQYRFKFKHTFKPLSEEELPTDALSKLGREFCVKIKSYKKE